MKRIGKADIENIAIGASLLGSGGGGDPYIGKLMALQAIDDYGEVTLLDPDEVPDDALVASSSMMGAPTVLVEKVPSGSEFIEAFHVLQRHLKKDIFAIFPIEAGGVNSMIPFALAPRLGLPVIDVDGMGRAFPELQMTTFHLHGASLTPAVLADEKGNSALLSTIDTVWAERLARAATIRMGGSTMVAKYPLTGRELKAGGVRNTLTLEETIGYSLLGAQAKNEDPIRPIVTEFHGIELFKGKVYDINRKTAGGFARGKAKFEGFAEYKNKMLTVNFQNEHLFAQIDGAVCCTTPDLLAVLDTETGRPITTEGIRYGMRCVIVGLPCNPKWRTPPGLKVVGPRYFGYEADYIPVEELAK